MSGWDACTLEADRTLRWIECHPGVAGYIQAAGVVATIAIAVLGPPLAREIGNWRAYRARKEATTRVILGSQQNVEALLERIGGRLETIGTYDEPDGTDSNLFLDNLMIEIPGPLDLGFYARKDFETARLEFLPQLMESARGYDIVLGSKRQEGVRPGEWDILRETVRAKLEDLKTIALSAALIIANERRRRGIKSSDDKQRHLGDSF